MSLTATIIAKLSRVDVDMARRALDTASAFDEPDATPPEQFTWGAGARCYALASICINRPQLFWGGLLATAAIPVLLIVKLLHHG
ncbi:hypothetical protein ACFQ3P_32875 [Paraburkholderia sabiae]|uniref:Uncharacterized protein n=1 Tax=Paraburkholderia sabiae TaxID=273251 RepID=A0ABU9QJ12_9BURK|nr:hypothetical protein [Paraburkholderia sabiae]WJZ79747.1 hypothetical protein QEN71_43700 [Paraburkholderia sabiae]CAD6559379.1 hypothetical protein LMG24235_06656 [Paraburkholderia sabiae]